jgi:hypothetical protein
MPLPPAPTQTADEINLPRIKKPELSKPPTPQAINAVAEDEVEFEPYKIVLCFNSKPSDEARHYLVDCIFTLKSKYRVDIELKSQELVSS